MDAPSGPTRSAKMRIKTASSMTSVKTPTPSQNPPSTTSMSMPAPPPQAANPERAATAYFLAGKHESDHGNFPQAKRYYESALHFQPDNSTLLIYYSATLMRTGQAAEALTYAQHAVVIAPDSPDAIGMLGFAQFASDHTPDAIRSWKKSLALRPDATISQYLARAERESTAESDFSQRESSHFNLHFEGKDTSATFRRDLLATL